MKRTNKTKKDPQLPENHDIDVVILWVDGSDEAWLRERANALGDGVSYKNANFRNWDNLRFVFRGIEKYMPWVRRVHFVTCGHLPSWLDTSHPKVRIVNHKDFIPEQYLPTFSSHSIELNLHRIEGLSENFIYFNDDMFALNPLASTDFFEKGLPRRLGVVNPVAPKYYGSISTVMVNNIAVANQHFKKRRAFAERTANWLSPRYGSLNLLNLMFLPWSSYPGLLQNHLPSPLKKSTMQEVWDAETEILDATCRRKFRDFSKDVNQWIFACWDVASNRFRPAKANLGIYLMIASIKDAKKAAKIIRSTRKGMLCLNDHLPEEISQEQFDWVIDTVNDAFSCKFPTRSSFERLDMGES